MSRMNTKSPGYLFVILLALSCQYDTSALADDKTLAGDGDSGSSQNLKGGSQIVVLDQENEKREEDKNLKTGRTNGRASSLHPPRKQDEVTLSARPQELIVSIKLRRGIGQTKIRLQGKNWPTVAQLRFKKFAGLEGLTATNGERMIALHASHNEPGEKQLAVVRNSDGFEVTFPRGFLRDQDRILSLQWVDFYR
jgi:hypothetical protein